METTFRHFLKALFARFRLTITELEYRALCVRKTWRSFLRLLPLMSNLSQSVKGKMIFWHLDPLWSPGCPNPRVESNDAKPIFIFVLFNKYYCVLSKNFVTYSTATQIYISTTSKTAMKTSGKIHMLVLLSSLCIPNILKALQVHSGPHFLTCGYY